MQHLVSCWLHLDNSCISARKVTMARLFNPTIVLVRRTHFRRNVPYLRTIIVIADIYWGLYSPAQHINTLDPPYLTFQHRSGVTPYTSSCEFAGSCVFVKQSAGNLSLRPSPRFGAQSKLFRSRNRSFCFALQCAFNFFSRSSASSLLRKSSM